MFSYMKQTRIFESLKENCTEPPHSQVAQNKGMKLQSPWIITSSTFHCSHK